MIVSHSPLQLFHSRPTEKAHRAIGTQTLISLNHDFPVEPSRTESKRTGGLYPASAFESAPVALKCKSFADLRRVQSDLASGRQYLERNFAAATRTSRASVLLVVSMARQPHQPEHQSKRGARNAQAILLSCDTILSSVWPNVPSSSGASAIQNLTLCPSSGS